MKIKALFAAALLFQPCTAPVAAWGPQAHAYLGRQAAAQAGLPERDRELIASGAFLADLDHTLSRPAPVGDSIPFASALIEVVDQTPQSDRWAQGWMAHVVQDRNQGPISSTRLKLYADLILGRSEGHQVAGVLYDPERIRRAAGKFEVSPKSTRALRRAAKRLLVLGVMEAVLLDSIPLTIEAPTATSTSPGSESDPLQEISFASLHEVEQPDRPRSTPARPLMPQALEEYEARIEASLEATRKLLLAPESSRDPKASTGDIPASGKHVTSRIPVSSARLLGLTLRTRELAGGLELITIRLTRPALMRAAVSIMLKKLGKDLFPSEAASWNAKGRIKARTAAMAQYLEVEVQRLEQMFE